MAERKSLSKKTRFEVFKRDAFECQYCGAHPPSTILHVDHIHPVAKGGKNDMDNLITACEACNQGKSDRELSDIPQSLQERATLILEKEAQIKGYQKVLNDRKARIEDEVEQVAEMYERYVPGYTLTDKSRVSVRMFIDRLGFHEVLDAMESACVKNIRASQEFKYFCGICWRKIKEGN